LRRHAGAVRENVGDESDGDGEERWWWSRARVQNQNRKEQNSSGFSARPLDVRGSATGRRFPMGLWFGGSVLATVHRSLDDGGPTPEAKRGFPWISADGKVAIRAAKLGNHLQYFPGFGRIVHDRCNAAASGLQWPTALKISYSPSHGAFIELVNLYLSRAASVEYSCARLDIGLRDFDQHFALHHHARPLASKVHTAMCPSHSPRRHPRLSRLPAYSPRQQLMYHAVVTALRYACSRPDVGH